MVQRFIHDSLMIRESKISKQICFASHLPNSLATAVIGEGNSLEGRPVCAARRRLRAASPGVLG